MNNNVWYRFRIIKKSQTHFRAEFLNDNENLIGYYENSNLNYDNRNWVIRQWKYYNTYDYWDWVRVRKYADQEPTITIQGNKIIIHNPNNYDLKDFQVKINISTIKDQFNGFIYPYCYEQENGECGDKKTNIVWTKIPLIKANSDLIIDLSCYQKGAVWELWYGNPNEGGVMLAQDIVDRKWSLN